MPFKVEVDPELCIGCSACANVCGNFELKDDGKAHPKQAKVAAVGCNQEAQEACPVKAIKVTQVK